MIEFMYSWPGMITMFIILCALIGLLLFLRSRRPEDD
jgi:hypothetical protein